MKIITKSVMRWVDDQLVVVEEESYEHTGPVAEAKGGGSSQRDLTQQELDILEAQLRGMNRAQAFEENYAYPMKERLASDVEGWGSLINANTAADRAGADVGKSFDRMQGKQDYDLASMGINPSDMRYVDAKNRMSIEGMGMQAAAMSGAREGRLKEGISMRQAYLTGNPINPNYANNAADLATSQGNATRQGAMADANGWYNATMGAGQLASVASNAGWFGGADGGPVRLEDGGFVHKGIKGYAKGGMIQDYSRMPMPDRGGKTPNPPTTGDYAMGLGKSAIASKPVMSAAKPYVDEAMVKMGFKEAAPEASQSLLDAGTQQAGAAAEDYSFQLAQDSANFMPDLATVGTEAAAEGATAAAGEAAAAEAAAIAAAEAAALEAAAAGTATAAAGAETGAVAGAPLGPVGMIAGAGLGALAGSFFAKDGGKASKQGIRPGTVGKTGKVQGPGGPKDDLIPAMLSDGEYVMPVGAVRFFGLDKLEKMRQKGLEYEKQLGIRRA